MEKGELSSEIPKRCLIIWEQGLAELQNQRQETFALRAHRWRRAVRAWEMDEHMEARVWDLWRRFNLRCDVVVTTRPPEFSEAVMEYLDAYDVPVRKVLTLSVEEIGRKLIFMPDVHAVLHRDPNLLWAFSSKGRLVEYGQPLNL